VWREPIARWLGNPDLALQLPPLGIFLALMLPAAAIEIVLIARKQPVGAAWTYAVSDLARTAFLILPALFFMGLGGVMAGAAMFAGVRLIAGVIGLWRTFGSELRPDAGQWMRQLAYALPFALAVGIEVLHVNWHQWAVASRFEAAAFAVYAVGCLQIPLVDLIVSSTVNVMMVEMAEDVQARGGAAAPALWHETIGRLAFVIFPLAAFLVLMAHPIITVLYTSTYEASVPVFMLWSLTMLASVLVVDGVLRVFAETRFLLLMNMIQLALVASLAGPLLAAFGLRGAVLATLLATALVKLMAVGRIVQLMRLPLARALPWQRLAAAAVCAALAVAPALWITRSIALPPVGLLLTVAPVYGCCYLLLYQLVSRHERPAMLFRASSQV
jgi:O-antigen/teichoic acid export membrane protein